MKKRVFALTAAVLFIASSMSMAPVIEDDSLKCIRWAEGEVHTFAGLYDEHPNDDPNYMDLYIALIDHCIANS